jgi:hypothetical protein
MIDQQTWLGQFNLHEITSPWNHFMRRWSRREILETGQQHSRDAKIFIRGLTITVQWFIPLNVFQPVFSWQNVGKQNFLHIAGPLKCNKRLLQNLWYNNPKFYVIYGNMYKIYSSTFWYRNTQWYHCNKREQYQYWSIPFKPLNATTENKPHADNP